MSERTSRRGYRSAQHRLQRWRGRAFLIAQCAVTAGLTWWLAQTILGHAAPFFAPVAAILVLNVTYGNRLRRGVEVAIGVAVGVGVGDAFVQVFGTGVWQIVIVAAVAMSLATLVGAGPLMTIQAAVQSIIVVTLLPDPGQGFGRWLDAVFGCAVALLIATIAPSAPLRRPGILAAQMLQEMAATLRAAVTALRESDPDAADQVVERARRGESQLAILQNAADDGLAVVRHSPFRRHQLGWARAYADLIDPLDRAQRNHRVLVRRSLVAIWRNECVPEPYLRLLGAIAGQIDRMAMELHEGKLPAAARKQLVWVARDSSHLPVADTINAVVLLAQARSMLVDLLELSGLDYFDARELVPDMD
ncbi:MAG: FUSC family protein [Microlunatus sp.]|nr:FUSC family protein [Microlunatus sp.]